MKLSLRKHTLLIPRTLSTRKSLFTQVIKQWRTKAILYINTPAPSPSFFLLLASLAFLHFQAKQKLHAAIARSSFITSSIQILLHGLSSSHSRNHSHPLFLSFLARQPLFPALSSWFKQLKVRSPFHFLDSLLGPLRQTRFRHASPNFFFFLRLLVIWHFGRNLGGNGLGRFSH